MNFKSQDEFVFMTFKKRCNALNDWRVATPPPPVMHFVTLRYISLTNQFETYKDDSRCVCFKRRNALQVVTLCCKPSLPVRQSCMLQHCCNFVIHVDQFQQLKYLDFVGVHQSCLLLYWAPCESLSQFQQLRICVCWSLESCLLGC